MSLWERSRCFLEEVEGEWQEDRLNWKHFIPSHWTVSSGLGRGMGLEERVSVKSQEMEL